MKHGPITKYPCGCQHDDRAWLQLCETHEREARELHDRAAAEYRQSRDFIERLEEARSLL